MKLIIVVALIAVIVVGIRMYRGTPASVPTGDGK